MPKQKRLFWISALAAAVLFDILFWKQALGISFFIWTAALLLIGYLLAWREQKRPSVLSWGLSLLILSFAFVPAWRAEPFTRVISVMLTLVGMLLLTATFLNGHWPFYRIAEHFTEFFKALFGGLSGAILYGTRFRNPPAVGEEPVKVKGRKGWAILRGVLIAVPVVTLFTILLSAADPVFGDWIRKVLNLERLPEYLFRLWYILMIGSFLVGIYLHAIYPRSEAKKPETMSAWMKPFLGWTETGIILGAVDILFITFVIIQVRYLFGGSANINETGYTFAEYARRGFGELVAVAVLSMMLYLGLNTISKRETRGAKIGFGAVSILLMANVLVMLVSSLQRLMLYEGAYGFSALRTYTHVFIYWLGALIVVAVVLELLRKNGRFALALMIAIVGFGATLVVMNVDSFIVQQNVKRAAAGEELDFNYLQQLSTDAIPAMVSAYLQPGLPAKAKEVLGSALACRTAELNAPVVGDSGLKSWQSFSISESKAARLLTDNGDTWSTYKVSDDEERGLTIMLDGVERSCAGYDWMD
jgi:hypothetical protein